MLSFDLEQPLTKLGVSARKFAQYTNIRPNTLSELRNDTAKMISFDMMDRILNGLNNIAKDRELGVTFDIRDIIKYEFINDQQVDIT